MGVGLLTYISRRKGLHLQSFHLHLAKSTENRWPRMLCKDIIKCLKVGFCITLSVYTYSGSSAELNSLFKELQ